MTGGVVTTMDSNNKAEQAVNSEIAAQDNAGREAAGDGTAIRSLAERRPILKKRIFLFADEFTNIIFLF